MKNLLLSTALLLATTGIVQAQTSPSCPDGTTTCNIATVGDSTITAPQTIGDTVNPTYSPDSASASATTGAIDVDNIVQGDTISTDATATGNHSVNDNRSTANNTGSANVSGGSITSTGGNITSSADTTGGNIDSRATTTSGPATTVSGPASTNSGAINTAGGAGGAGGSADAVVAGSGNSRSVSGATGGAGGRATGGNATGGSSRAVTGASTSRATGGAGGRATGGAARSSSGGNTISGGNSTTNVDASQRTTIKHAANTAAMIDMQGYGTGNCLGDTNPSGQFGASIQTFGWGVTANSMKASNVCAMLKIAGPRAALAYLAQMDRNAHAALVNNGLAVTRAEIEAQTRAEIEADRVTAAEVAQTRTVVRCPTGSAFDGKGCKIGHRGAAVATVSTAAPAPAANIPTCPTGSRWDGKGCWMARK